MNNKLALIQTIRVLKARYCRFVDTKDWASLADLFCENPTIRIFGTDGEKIAAFETVEGFMEITKNYLAGAKTIHQVHNDEVEVISENEIQAIWSMEDYLLFPEINDGRPASLHGYGHYYETWRLTGSAWRLAQLELRRTIVEIKPKEVSA